MRTRTLTEASLFTAIFVVMALMSFYLPAVVYLFVLIMALPHAVLTYRHGIKVGVLSTVASILILILLMDIVVAFTVVAMFATVGVALGYGAARFSAGWTIMIGTLVGAVGFAVLLLIVTQLVGIDIYNDTINIYRETLKTAFDNGQLGTAFEFENVEQVLDLLGRTLKPAMILLIGLMLSYINYRTLQAIGTRFKIDVPKMKSLFQWRFPTWVGVVYVLGNVLVFVSAPESMIKMVGLNINFIFSIPVVLQGISLSVIFFSKYIRSKIFYLILLIVIFANQLLMKIVSILGLFDMLFNYREWVLEKGDKK